MVSIYKRIDGVRCNGFNSRSLAMRLGRPGAYPVIHPQKVLRNDDSIVSIVETTDQFTPYG
jgi:hypothetical protein